VQGLGVPGLDLLLVLLAGLGALTLGVERGVERRQVKLFSLDRIRQFQPLVIKCDALVPRAFLWWQPTNS
jgi:hypothetical protein